MWRTLMTKLPRQASRVARPSLSREEKEGIKELESEEKEAYRLSGLLSREFRLW